MTKTINPSHPIIANQTGSLIAPITPIPPASSREPRRSIAAPHPTPLRPPPRPPVRPAIPRGMRGGRGR